MARAGFVAPSKPRSRRRYSAIKAPKSAPVIQLVGIMPGQHVLRFADASTPDRTAKPYGASELQLFIAIGDKPDAPVSEARYHGKFTRYPAVVEFSDADDGKIATHYGRWVTRRGDEGPWSDPVSMRIVA